jgi:HECT-domain (ubiquitin-transferase)
LFLNDDDRSLVDKALVDFLGMSQTEKENLTTVFGAFGMYANPTARNVKQLLTSIARQQLVDLPAPFVDQMRMGVPGCHMDSFWSVLTVPAINVLFQMQLPTPEKVKAVMTAEEADLRQEQINCMYYLQQFVGRLDQEELSKFLHFVTGSSVMPENILVRFNTLTGALRRPIAHTCTNVLELSSTYSSFQELKREFMSVLHNPACFQMTMV